MQDVERAIADIASIRSRLAASNQFRGYSPESLVAIAAMAVLLGSALRFWPNWLAPGTGRQVLAWGTLMLASCVALTIEAMVRSRRQHGEMARLMLRSALRGMLPFTFVGAATAVVLAVHAPAQLWLAPGLWLQLTGLVCFSWQPIMPRAIIWPGLWYLLAGTTVMVTGGASGQVDPLVMAAALASGHLAIAFVLFRAEEGAREDCHHD